MSAVNLAMSPFSFARQSQAFETPSQPKANAQASAGGINYDSGPKKAGRIGDSENKIVASITREMFADGGEPRARKKGGLA